MEDLDYGHIQINLNKLIEKQGISKNLIYKLLEKYSN